MTYEQIIGLHVVVIGVVVAGVFIVRAMKWMRERG